MVNADGSKERYNSDGSVVITLKEGANTVEYDLNLYTGELVNINGNDRKTLYQDGSYLLSKEDNYFPASMNYLNGTVTTFTSATQRETVSQSANIKKTVNGDTTTLTL